MTVSPTSKQLHLIQKNLGRHNFYTGPIKSSLTVGVVKGIQRSLVPRGYTGAISGSLNSDTQKYIQLVARRGGYKGAINSNLDTASWNGFVAALQQNKLTQATSDKSFTNVTAPAVTGTAKVGQTLTATAGTYSVTGTTNTFQWSKGGTPISGATSATYVPVTGDIGAALIVTVTAAKNGYTLATPSAATAAVVA